MIYLVEDDRGIRDLTLYTLNNSGLAARGFPDGKAFWDALEKEKPDLALLDIMLPGEDGLSILKRLRASPETARLPVMMLTARGTEYDKILGLDCGADDYLAKPFGMMEMAARVRSLLRRTRIASAVLAAVEAGAKTGAKAADEYRLGELRVNIPRHSVTAGTQDCTLTIKEFDLLVFLLQNKDIVFSREHLLEQVWGYRFAGETRTVDAHILTLRNKLGGYGGLIQTVRGVGYKIGENP
jgi:two-component system alkaline phosphatase synthesis response regulator PhoP